MEGKNTCWIPGIDHASIATETKVVKMLEEMGIEKEQLSREEFLDHAWKWKEKYGGIIIDQLKKLGCSCDWKRQKFTMDDDYSRSVIKAFVHLYNKGFIYKGQRLVNWCPSSQSAISDEELSTKKFQESYGILNILSKKINLSSLLQRLVQRHYLAIQQ